MGGTELLVVAGALRSTEGEGKALGAFVLRGAEKEGVVVCEKHTFLVFS